MEFDELGFEWDHRQTDTTLSIIKSRAAEANTFVVVFVHGWHHGADCCDGNVVCFKSLLARIQDDLQKPPYRLARFQLTGDSSVRVVGVYVGWRGRSLPGWLDYFSFYSRKSAAERLGHASLRNLLHRLDAVYDEQNAASQRFFGLVTIGHSFGGQAVFRAISDRMETELVALQHAPPSRPRIVDGVGDLTILVNPAVEAGALRRMQDATDSIGRFNPLQTPVLAVFSAEDDWARNLAFPFGRRLGSLLAARRSSEQHHEDITALGVARASLTHSLRWSPPLADSVSATASIPERAAVASLFERTDGERSCRACEWNGAAAFRPDSVRLDVWRPDTSTTMVPIVDFALRPLDIDFARDLRLGGVALENRREAVPYSPIVVAKSTADVFSGHNGIFTSRFSAFLTKYVAYIESKRLLTRRLRLKALQ